MTSAAVAFGGNVGRPDLAFGQALARLCARPDVRVIAVSSLYRTEPWGNADQPDFLNGVALVETSASPRQLLATLRAEERAAGRERSEPWAPRTLDLDLLWYGDRVADGRTLTLPHPRLAERSFVLEPLAEVASGWCHPRTGASAAEMLDELRSTGRATACERLPVPLGERLEAESFEEAACRS